MFHSCRYQNIKCNDKKCKKNKIIFRVDLNYVTLDTLAKYSNKKE